VNLLVVIIVLGLRHRGLLLEPAATIGHLVRRWRDMWLQRGLREDWAAPLVMALIVLLPALLLAIFLNVFDGLWQRVLEGLAGLIVLALIVLDQRQPGVLKRMQAEWQARAWPGEGGSPSKQLASGIMIDRELAPARQALLEEQLRELFAPLFWFLLLGPVAALAYHLLRLMAEGDEGPAVTYARQLLHYAEWPVARVLALSFALAGDFTSAWQHWLECALDREMTALDLLDASMVRAQSVDLKGAPDAVTGVVLTQALGTMQGLLHRALVLWIVLLALHTLLWF